MNKKQTKYLLTKYPKLYQQYYWPITDTCMCWGFPGAGWLKLIDGLSRRITKLDSEGKVQCIQCKEKFGGLRFYVGPVSAEISDKVFDLIRVAEEKSLHICEECGAKGKLQDMAGWYTTLCQKHLRQRIKPQYLPKKWAKLKKFRHEKNTKYKS